MGRQRAYVCAGQLPFHTAQQPGHAHPLQNGNGRKEGHTGCGADQPQLPFPIDDEEVADQRGPEGPVGCALPDGAQGQDAAQERIDSPEDHPKDAADEENAEGSFPGEGAGRADEQGHGAHGKPGDAAADQ